MTIQDKRKKLHEPLSILIENNDIILYLAADGTHYRYDIHIGRNLRLRNHDVKYMLKTYVSNAKKEISYFENIIINL